jgi:aromatic ring hydroxylase
MVGINGAKALSNLYMVAHMIVPVNVMRRKSKKQTEQREAQFKQVKFELEGINLIVRRPIDTIDMNCLYEKVEHLLDNLVKLRS